MLCVSVGSNRHGKMVADCNMLAENRIKLVEYCIDHISTSVDFKRLLGERPCKILISCRRESDGGQWTGSDDDRMMLIRNAIVDKVDYIELESDIAATVPRFGDTKRLISYYDLNETPDDLADIHARMTELDADVIKIVGRANSVLDNLRMMDLVKTAKVPTVAYCTGPLGAASQVLQRAWGAPITFAVLPEEGRARSDAVDWKTMKSLYRGHRINKKSVLFGIVHDSERLGYESIVHNKCYRAKKFNCVYLPFRVPPEELEDFVQSTTRWGICGLSVGQPYNEEVLEYLTKVESSSHEIGNVTSVQISGEQRRGFNTDFRASMDCVLSALRADKGSPEPLKGSEILILGADGFAPAMAWGLRQQGASIHISSENGMRAEAVAASLGAKSLAWETRHEIEPRMIINATQTGAHPDMNVTPYDEKYLHPSMTVFDTIYKPEQTLLIKQARKKKCAVVTGVDLLSRQMAYEFKLFTNQEPPLKYIRQVITDANLASG